MTVEAVVVMLNNMGNNPISWDDCRKVLKGGDFINRVISFDSNSTSSLTVQRIETKYIQTEQWDADKIMRASKVSPQNVMLRVGKASGITLWINLSYDPYC